MVHMVRVVRNGLIGLAIALAFVAYGARVKAQSYGNCSDVTASWNWASVSYCGPYAYENESYVLGDLTNTAYSYVTDYYWGYGVYLYWWGRDTPFDQDAYYSAGFEVY
jgi:hypothetical protein